MNLKKIFGRAKRTIAAHHSSRSTISSLSSTQCSPPILACSNRDAPHIQMHKLRITTNANSSDSLAAAKDATCSVGGPKDVMEEMDASKLTLGSDVTEKSALSANVSPSASLDSGSRAGGDGAEMDEKEQEEAVLKAWGKNQELKKLAIPTDYPDYMREPPQLVYSETETSQLRRQCIAKKIKSYQHQPLKRNKKLLEPGPLPKLNRTASLRKSFIHRQPIMSQRFQRHYSLYNRPPFKHTNVKMTE